jgi:antitoxin component YwqK of YwqJK toxin-antitoxin module
MADVWYVIRDKKARGPFAAQQLKLMVAKGLLLPADVVRKEDEETGRAAGSIKWLFPNNAEAAPVQPTAVRKPAAQPNPAAAPRATPAPTRTPTGDSARDATCAPSRRLVIVSVVAGSLLLCCGGLGMVGVIGSRLKDSVQKEGTQGRTTEAEKEIASAEDRNKYIAEVEASTTVPALTFTDGEYKYDYSKDDYGSIPVGAKRETRKRIIKGGAAELAGKPEIMNGYVDSLGKFVEHGTYITWTDETETKKMREGEILHGKQHGLTTFFYPSGKKKWEMYFVHDKKHGIARSWYENGQLEDENPSSDGLTHGRFRQWHESGEPKTDETWVRGKEHGLHKKWWKGGVLAFVGCFREGKRYGKLYSWNEDGSPAESGEWDGDRPKGKCRLAFKGGDQKFYFIEADDGEWKGGATAEFIARMYYFSLKDRPSAQLQFDPRNRIANYYSATEAEFFSRFGKPSQEATDFEKVPANAPPPITSKYRIWTYRCRDGSITLRVQPTQSGSLLVISRP